MVNMNYGNHSVRKDALAHCKFIKYQNNRCKSHKIIVWGSLHSMKSMRLLIKWTGRVRKKFQEFQGHILQHDLGLRVCKTHIQTPYKASVFPVQMLSWEREIQIAHSAE